MRAPTNRRLLLNSAAIAAIATALTLFPAMASAQDLPSATAIQSGVTPIPPNTDVDTVEVVLPRAYVAWNSFDVPNGPGNGPDFTVTYAGPGNAANAILVNRVLNGGEASNINGRIQSDVQFWLLNSAGILFGENGQVSAPGVLLSTASNLAINGVTTNTAAQESASIAASPLALPLNVQLISAAGIGAARIDVQGAVPIEATSGSILLAADRIDIAGGSTLTARRDIALLSGGIYEVELGNDLSFATLRVSGGGRDIQQAGPNPTNGIFNEGTLVAGNATGPTPTGGNVILAATAGDSEDAVRTLIHSSGALRATRVSEQDGMIIVSTSPLLDDAPPLDALNPGAATAVEGRAGVTLAGVERGDLKVRAAGDVDIVGNLTTDGFINIQTPGTVSIGNNVLVQSDRNGVGDTTLGDGISLYERELRIDAGTIDAAGSRLRAGSGNVADVPAERSKVFALAKNGAIVGSVFGKYAKVTGGTGAAQTTRADSDVAGNGEITSGGDVAGNVDIVGATSSRFGGGDVDGNLTVGFTPFLPTDVYAGASSIDGETTVGGRVLVQGASVAVRDDVIANGSVLLRATNDIVLGNYTAGGAPQGAAIQITANADGLDTPGNTDSIEVISANSVSGNVQGSNADLIGGSYSAGLFTGQRADVFVSAAGDASVRSITSGTGFIQAGGAASTTSDSDTLKDMFVLGDAAASYGGGTVGGSLIVNSFQDANVTGDSTVAGYADVSGRNVNITGDVIADGSVLVSGGQSVRIGNGVTVQADAKGAESISEPLAAGAVTGLRVVSTGSVASAGNVLAANARLISGAEDVGGVPQQRNQIVVQAGSRVDVGQAIGSEVSITAGLRVAVGYADTTANLLVGQTDGAASPTAALASLGRGVIRGNLTIGAQAGVAMLTGVAPAGAPAAATTTVDGNTFIFAPSAQITTNLSTKGSVVVVTSGDITVGGVGNVVRVQSNNDGVGAVELTLVSTAGAINGANGVLVGGIENGTAAQRSNVTVAGVTGASARALSGLNGLVTTPSGVASLGFGDTIGNLTVTQVLTTADPATAGASLGRAHVVGGNLNIISEAGAASLTGVVPANVTAPAQTTVGGTATIRGGSVAATQGSASVQGDLIADGAVTIDGYSSVALGAGKRIQSGADVATPGALIIRSQAGAINGAGSVLESGANDTARLDITVSGVSGAVVGSVRGRKVDITTTTGAAQTTLATSRVFGDLTLSGASASMGGGTVDGKLDVIGTTGAASATNTTLTGAAGTANAGVVIVNATGAATFTGGSATSLTVTGTSATASPSTVTGDMTLTATAGNATATGTNVTGKAVVTATGAAAFNGGSAGSLDITGASVTASPTTVTGNLTAKATNGDANVNGAVSGVVDITATGGANFTGGSAGSLSVNGASAQVGLASITGNLSVTVTNGDASVAAITVGGAVVIKASGAAFFSVSTAGSLNLTGASATASGVVNGDATLTANSGAANFSGTVNGNLTVTAATEAAITAATTVHGGATLTGGTVRIAGNLLADGSIDLIGQSAVTIGDVKVQANANNDAAREKLRVIAQTGSVTAANGSVLSSGVPAAGAANANAGDVVIAARNNIDIDDIAGRDVMIGADTGHVVVGKVAAVDDVVISAKTDVQIESASAAASSAAGDAIHIDPAIDGYGMAFLARLAQIADTNGGQVAVRAGGKVTIAGDVVGNAGSANTATGEAGLNGAATGVLIEAKDLDLTGTTAFLRAPNGAVRIIANDASKPLAVGDVGTLPPGAPTGPSMTITKDEFAHIIAGKGIDLQAGLDGSTTGSILVGDLDILNTSKANTGSTPVLRMLAGNAGEVWITGAVRAREGAVDFIVGSDSKAAFRPKSIKITGSIGEGVGFNDLKSPLPANRFDNVFLRTKNLLIGQAYVVLTDEQLADGKTIDGLLGAPPASTERDKVFIATNHLEVALSGISAQQNTAFLPGQFAGIQVGSLKLDAGLGPDDVPVRTDLFGVIGLGTPTANATTAASLDPTMLSDALRAVGGARRAAQRLNGCGIGNAASCITLRPDTSVTNIQGPPQLNFTALDPLDFREEPVTSSSDPTEWQEEKDQ